MIATTRYLLAAAVVAMTTAAFAPRAVAQPSAPVRLLDVPYLPQTVALCGGAAAAMVMRYWGATGVYAETFASLVNVSEGGIRGQDLLAALQARGWDARSFRGDAALVQRQLADGRPVIALIEDRPGRFHYIVIVGWTNGRIIAHDPARAPFRVFDEAPFTTAWERSNFWTMLAAPGPASTPVSAPTGAAAPGAAPPPVRASAPSACDGLVEEGVRLAGAGDIPGARRLLQLAGEACPGASGPWRELAGIHALASEWKEAAAEARRAIERDANDTHAWRILATSLYLEGRFDEALGAWNRVGEPRLDLVDIKGLDRTRFVTVLSAMKLEPQAVLTPAALTLARRRLAELPSAQTSRVTFRPGGDGQANVDAVVLERPLVPASPIALAATGVRMLTNHELQASVVSPTGGGEVWTAAWRWWEHRPALSVSLTAPAPVAGVWGVRLYSEEETFAAAAGTTAERRRGGALTMSDWTRGGFRWELSAGAETWRPGARSARVGGSLEKRLPGDRVSMGVRASSWAGTLSTWTADVRIDGRSSVRHEGIVWLARGGVALAGSSAPLMLWAGADTGTARDVLLRAHPLVDDGIVSRAVFGRTLAHGGAEVRRWTQPLRKALRVAPAAFVDAARAGRTRAPFDTRLHIDAGVGLRVAVPGAGVVRVDVGRGLRDGNTALSVGWTR